jgi:hypothetical protein
MPPLAIDVMEAQRAGLLRAEQAQMAEAARRWLGVEQALQVQVDALALELQRDGGSVTMGQLQRSRRYQELQRQVDAELGRYASYLNGRIVDGQRTMALNALSHSQATIQAIAAEAEIVVQFNQLPVAAVENMIGLAGDGSPVRALLDEAAAAGPDAMAQELVNGIALGRNPLEVARRAIRQGLGQSFTRMATIARTEQLRVYRETTLQSYRASNVVMGYRRLSARDSRTCIACLFADGRYYELGESFDQHPNCIVGGTVVNSPSVLATSKRWFDGEVIEIRTVNGNVLTVTPNHPVLTDKGWVAAHLLKEGDNVISSLDSQRAILTADPYSDGSPSIIEDVVESFARAGGMAAVSVPTSTEDFHGDGGHGDVDIVRADGFLHDWRQSVISQPLGELPFGFGSMGLHTFLTDSTFAKVFNRALFPAHGSMSGGNVSHSLFVRPAGLQEPVSFGLPADFHAGFNQAPANYVAADSILGGDGILRFTDGVEADDFGNWHGHTPIVGWDSVPFQVSEQRSSADVVAGANNAVAIPVGVIADGIVNLTRRQFSGHVYNLQTSTGWYIAEGIITHNCRCTLLPVLRNVPATQYETGQQWFRRQPDSTQRAMMGRGRYEAWRARAVSLDDLVSRDWDDVWGGSLRPTRVSDL